MRCRRTPREPAVDDFKRIMGMEGVRPLDRPGGGPRKTPRPTSIGGSPAAATPEPPGYAWVAGPRARIALETALERLAAEVRDGRPGWAVGIREDGGAVPLSASSGAAALLAAADRKSLRLMIVGGGGWTFVMHPMMGVATLDEDPK